MTVEWSWPSVEFAGHAFSTRAADDHLRQPAPEEKVTSCGLTQVGGLQDINLIPELLTTICDTLLLGRKSPDSGDLHGQRCNGVLYIRNEDRAYFLAQNEGDGLLSPLTGAGDEEICHHPEAVMWYANAGVRLQKLHILLCTAPAFCCSLLLLCSHTLAVAACSFAWLLWRCCNVALLWVALHAASVLATCLCSQQHVLVITRLLMPPLPVQAAGCSTCWWFYH